jgi:hypothetical protein
VNYGLHIVKRDDFLRSPLDQGNVMPDTRESESEAAYAL